MSRLNFRVAHLRLSIGKVEFFLELSNYVSAKLGREPMLHIAFTPACEQDSLVPSWGIVNTVAPALFKDGAS